MAINNKPASSYAKPHKMSGKGVSVQSAQAAVQKPGNPMDTFNIAVGGVSKGNAKPTKTSGVKIRGTGAATKGTMARGPMA